MFFQQSNAIFWGMVWGMLFSIGVMAEIPTVDSNKSVTLSEAMFEGASTCNCDIILLANTPEKPKNGHLMNSSGIITEFPFTIGAEFIDTIQFKPSIIKWGTGTISWALSTDLDTEHDLTIAIEPATKEEESISFLSDFVVEYQKLHPEKDENNDWIDPLTSITVHRFPTKGQLKKDKYNLNSSSPMVDQGFLDSLVYVPNTNRSGEDTFSFSTNESESIITVSITIDPVDDPVQFKLKNQLPANKSNQMLPIIINENEPVSFVPYIIEPDYEAYDVVIETESDSVHGIIKDSTLLDTSTVALFPKETSDSGDPILMQLNKNSRYFFSDPNNTVTLNIKTSNNQWQPVSLDPPYELVLDHNFPTGNNNLQLVCESCATNTVSLNVVENTIFTFGVSNAPEWMSIDNISGEISGTPIQKDVGTHEPIIFKVLSKINNKKGFSPAIKTTVVNVNDMPITSDLPSDGDAPFLINEDATIVIDLNVSDIDPQDTHTFFVSAEASPKYGETNTNPANKQQLIYTHSGSEESTIEVFKYFAIDNQDGKSQPSTITINIVPINDAPVVSPIAVITPRDAPISIQLFGNDAEDDMPPKQPLAYTVMTNDGPVSPPANYYTYTAPESTQLDDTIATIPLTYHATDSEGVDSESAPLIIYFYAKNNAHDGRMRMPDIDFEIGDHLEPGTTIWDINNEITDKDLAENALIQYQILPENDCFDIHEGLGRIKIKQPLSSCPSEQVLNIYAKSQHDDTSFTGVWLTAIINIQTTLLSIDDIDNIGSNPNEKFNLNFNGEFNKDVNSGKNFTIDTGSNIQFKSSTIGMNRITIGGLEESVVSLEPNAHLTATTIVMSKDNGHHSTLSMHSQDASLTVNEDLTIGENGTAKLLLSQGKTLVKKSIIMGRGHYSNGQLTVSGNAELQASSLILGEEGAALLNQSGGKLTIDNDLIIGSDNASATVNISNGSFIANTINIHPNADVLFTGGTLRTNDITGVLKNNGGTFIVGEDKPEPMASLSAATFRALSAPSPIQRHTTITGHYIQGIGNAFASNLIISIASGTDGAENGKLIISESATLDGQLTVIQTQPFEFIVGQQFQLIDAATINGHFTTVTLPTLSPDLSWDLRELYSEGTITVAHANAISSAEKKAFIYPNPIRPPVNDVSVFYTLQQSQPIFLDIYNSFGRKVYQHAIPKGALGARYSDQLVSLPGMMFNQYPSGTYLIIVHNGKTTLARGKFSIVPSMKNPMIPIE